MAEKLVLSFKRNGSFAIRNGWFDKAITVWNENNGDSKIFSNANGVAYLGVGANMVPSIRYWLIAAGLLTKGLKKTPFTELLEIYDPYFENINTWWLIHYSLATNLKECPVFYAFFNGVDRNKGTKSDYLRLIQNYFETLGQTPNESYVESDFSVCINSYCDSRKDEEETPEDNYTSPLSKLGLIKKYGRDGIEKIEQDSSTIDYKLIYLSFLNAFEKEDSFTIDDALTREKGPKKIFNISRAAMISFLDHMQRKDLITFNRTAGLNTIYFKKKIDKDELIKDILK